MESTRKNSIMSKNTAEISDDDNPGVGYTKPVLRPSYGRASSMRSLNVIFDNESDDADNRSILNSSTGRSTSKGRNKSQVSDTTYTETSNGSLITDETNNQESDYSKGEKDATDDNESDEEDSSLDEEDRAFSNRSPQYMSASMTASDLEAIGNSGVSTVHSRHAGKRSKSTRSNRSSHSVRSSKSKRSVKSTSSQTPIADRFAEDKFLKKSLNSKYSSGMCILGILSCV